MQPAQKIGEFDVVIFDRYAASLYLHDYGYPVSAKMSLFGYLSDYTGKTFGRARFLQLPKIRKLLCKTTFCSVAGDEGTGKYRLEVWRHANYEGARVIGLQYRAPAKREAVITGKITRGFPPETCRSCAQGEIPGVCEGCTVDLETHNEKR